MLSKSPWRKLFLIASMLTLVSCDGGTTLTGFVRDTNGQPIEGASLRLESPSGSKSEVLSHANGSYKTSILHSPFKTKLIVTVSKKGYKTYRQEFPSGELQRKYDVVLERGES
ncbi:MAG TPA: carboxypeptidase-like regulatory domain-containing protein [Pyrinomonadaceae bacterium]|jgi:hypothetical protein